MINITVVFTILGDGRADLIVHRNAHGQGNNNV